MASRGEKLKKCGTCGEIKSRVDFFSHVTNRDRLESNCKACRIRRSIEVRRAKMAALSPVDRAKIFAKKASDRSARYAASPEMKFKKAIQSKARYPQNKHKILARIAVKRALKSGALIREPCRNCAWPKTEGHHTDYSRPLDVIWLCTSCHRLEHSKERRSANGQTAR